jgi:hypothetical protein
MTREFRWFEEKLLATLDLNLTSVSLSRTQDYIRSHVNSLGGASVAHWKQHFEHFELLRITLNISICVLGLHLPTFHRR